MLVCTMYNEFKCCVYYSDAFRPWLTFEDIAKMHQVEPQLGKEGNKHQG